MTTKNLLRAMALIAAAGGAMAVVMPFLRTEPGSPAKRRRAARRPAATSASTATPAKATSEKSARAGRARRSGNGGSPSHH